MSGGKKSKNDKEGKKDKKDKKHKHKSRGLEAGEHDLPEEDSDSDSSSCDEEVFHGMNPPAVPSACARPRCEFGDKCFRRNPDHKKQFCHPDDADWSVGSQAPLQASIHLQSQFSRP